MMDLLMIKYGEIILKGLNRPAFEEKLIKNMKRKLYGLGEIKLIKQQATIYVEPKKEGYDYDEAINRLRKVFGIIWIVRVSKLPKDIDVIGENAVKCLEATRAGNKTFKVEAKRPDKSFPHTSPQIQQIVGEALYNAFHPEMSVNVVEPDIVVTVEIRSEGAYVYAKKEKGPGGLPCGINGRCALLLSGGIDSPVAAYKIAKRGVDLIGIHFHSHPYTSDRAKQKVVDLARILTEYTGDLPLFIVPFTDIQLEIHEKAPRELTVILMRRAMMRIAERIAIKNNAEALVTGESLGQVASQTIAGIAATNSAVSIPVFRPLIGMDKEEIICLAREINTFETSIQPYEDCCTVFVPKHPKIRPRLEAVIEAENRIPNIHALIDVAILNAQVCNSPASAEHFNTDII